MQVQRVAKNVETHGDFDVTLGDLSKADLGELLKAMGPLGNIVPALDSYESGIDGYVMLNSVMFQLSRVEGGSRLHISPLDPNNRKDVDDAQRAARLLNVDAALYDGNKWAARWAEAGRVLREMRRNLNYLRPEYKS